MLNARRIGRCDGFEQWYYIPCVKVETIVFQRDGLCSLVLIRLPCSIVIYLLYRLKALLGYYH